MNHMNHINHMNDIQRSKYKWLWSDNDIQETSNIKCVQTTGKQAVQWKETWYETYTNINTNTDRKTSPKRKQQHIGVIKSELVTCFYGRANKLTSLQPLEFLIMFKQSNKWAESIVSYYGHSFCTQQMDTDAAHITSSPLKYIHRHTFTEPCSTHQLCCNAAEFDLREVEPLSIKTVKGIQTLL